jgi:TPR repeat protein
MNKMLMRASCSIVFALLCAGAVQAGDFEDGWAAYERKDYATALTKFRRAAQQGSASAQFNIGLMYDEGQGVAQDYKEAVRWYKLAAAQGNAKAQFNLGVSYGKGEGVVQDYVRAHMWLNLAAIGGDARAVKNRDIVAAKMTPQQISEAQKLARECQARDFKNCD